MSTEPDFWRRSADDPDPWVSSAQAPQDDDRWSAWLPDLSEPTATDATVPVPTPTAPVGPAPASGAGLPPTGDPPPPSAPTSTSPTAGGSHLPPPVPVATTPLPATPASTYLGAEPKSRFPLAFIAMMVAPPVGFVALGLALATRVLRAKGRLADARLTSRGVLVLGLVAIFYRPGWALITTWVQMIVDSRSG